MQNNLTDLHKNAMHIKKLNFTTAATAGGGGRSTLQSGHHTTQPQPVVLNAAASGTSQGGVALGTSGQVLPVQ